MKTLTDTQDLAIMAAANHITTHKAIRETGGTPAKEYQNFVISGYPGTGKTVAITALLGLLDQIGYRGAICAFTGRASENLNERGTPCTTIHQVFYEAVLDSHGNLKYFRQLTTSEILEQGYDYIIFEEASMNNYEMIKPAIDTGLPIIHVGDDDQLPPIEGKSIFQLIETEPEFSKTPIVFFDEVKRTEDGSQIPLLAEYVRSTGKYSKTFACDHIEFARKGDINLKWFIANWRDWDAIICGTNKQRKKFNRLIRFSMGYHDELPEVGERIICLSNNVIHGTRINNGELFHVCNVFPGEEISTLQIRKLKSDGSSSDTMVTVKVDNNMWGDDECPTEKHRSNREISQFSFGYALTVHKFQGSSSPNIIVYDEDVSFFLNQRKFRNTALTRASERVLIVE